MERYVMREKAFETKIRDYLDDLGAYNVKYFGNAFSQAGVPDLLCCLRGVFIAIEVKAERGKPSELQLHNLRKIHEAGGRAILAYPKDWEVLKAMLKLWYDGCYFAFDDEYEKHFVPRFTKN